MSSHITGTSNGPFTLFLKQKLLQKVIYLLGFSASKPLCREYTSFATKLDSISSCQHFLPLLIKTTECASELHPYLYDIPWKVCKRFNRILSKPSAWGNFSVSPTWSTRPTTGCRSKINFIVGPQKPLLATVKRWKRTWFGHVTRHDSLSKTTLQGTLEDGQYCGWQRNYWMDYIKGWTYQPMLTMASCGKDWKRISAESFLMSPWLPNQSRSLTTSVPVILCMPLHGWWWSGLHWIQTQGCGSEEWKGCERKDFGKMGFN